MKVSEMINLLERLKSEIEWDYSLEYQVVLKHVIAVLKVINEKG